MILRTDALAKRFGETTAVAGVSLAVEAGEFFAIVGPSGCGKTTTLRLLAGLESPTAGRVELAGRDVTDRPPRDRDTNLVFQDLVLFPHMTVAENVGYGLARDGVPEAERRERVTEMLETVGLAGFDERAPASLSGGQRQRVALARALVNEPSVLLLDEPLSSLDRTLRTEMRTELRRIQRDVGTTFLYVTHDQETALSMADRMAVMRDGRVVESGTPSALYDRPRTAFVADFLGDANLLPATIQERRNDRATVEAGGGRFDAAVDDGLPDGPATVVVRPEDLRPGGDTLSGTVRSVSYKGAHEEYAVDLAGGETVRVRARTDGSLTVGETVGLDVVDASLVADRDAKGGE
jgi:spermidine/putrescine transport system ATP-binding protein